VADIPELLDNLLTTMLNFKDGGPTIFSKACALLQLLDNTLPICEQIRKPPITKKLKSFHKLVTDKKKKNEINKKRRSFQLGGMAAPAPATPRSRTPLGPRSASSMNQLNRTVSTTQLNSTFNRPRKGSTEVETCLPWAKEEKPRFHVDVAKAIDALVGVLGIDIS